MHKYFITFIGAALLAAGIVPAVAPAAVAQAAEGCAGAYSAGSRVSSGFAAPANAFSSDKETVIGVHCTESGSAVVTFGTGKSTDRILNQALYWESGRWRPLPLIGFSQAGGYFTGKAYGVIRASVAQGGTFVTGKVCDTSSGVLRCPAQWQLQKIVHTSGSDTRDDMDSNTRDNDTWLMGYYPGYVNGDYPLSKVPFEHITHVVVGPVVPQSDASLDTEMHQKNEREGERMAKDAARRAHKEGAKALLWVGGPNTQSGWIASTETPAMRAALAKNLIELADELGYDGADLNWEPILAENEADLLAFIKELRRQDSDFIITLPVNWIRENGAEARVSPFYKNAAQYLDRMFIMTYSMNGVWSGWESWHNSALRGADANHPTSVETSVDAYLEAGVPRGKLGFGIPFYGRCYSGGVDGPRQELHGGGTQTAINSINYRTIMTEYFDRDNERWDSAAQAPYLSFDEPEGRHDCTFITYENERSIKAKAEYAKDRNLGGVMVWALGQGYLPDEPARKEQPLIRAAYDALFE